MLAPDPSLRAVSCWAAPAGISDLRSYKLAKRSVTGNDPLDAAREAAELLRPLPPGAKCLFLQNPQNVFNDGGDYDTQPGDQTVSNPAYPAAGEPQFFPHWNLPVAKARYRDWNHKFFYHLRHTFNADLNHYMDDDEQWPLANIGSGTWSLRNASLLNAWQAHPDFYGGGTYASPAPGSLAALFDEAFEANEYTPHSGRGWANGQLADFNAESYSLEFQTPGIPNGSGSRTFEGRVTGAYNYVLEELKIRLIDYIRVEPLRHFYPRCQYSNYNMAPNRFSFARRANSDTNGHRYGAIPTIPAHWSFGTFSIYHRWSAERFRSTPFVTLVSSINRVMDFILGCQDHGVPLLVYRAPTYVWDDASNTAFGMRSRPDLVEEFDRHAHVLGKAGDIHFNIDFSSGIPAGTKAVIDAKNEGQALDQYWQVRDESLKYTHHLRGDLVSEEPRLNNQGFVWTARYVAGSSGPLGGRVTFDDGVNTATFSLGGRSVTVQRPAGEAGSWFFA